MGISEILWALAVYVALPAFAYWVTERAFSLGGLRRDKRVVGYAAVIAAGVVSWYASQLYVGIAFLVLFLLPFVALIVIKVSLKKAVGAALAWCVTYFLLSLLAAIVAVSVGGFS